MNKKKVDNLLKGVASAGVVVGGASVIGNADVVYAQEMEMANATGVMTLELEEDKQEVSESESTSESESESASDSVSTLKSTLTSESLSASTNAASTSESLSLSESAANSVSESYSIATSEADSTYNQVHSEFIESGYEDSYLEELIMEIEQKKVSVAREIQKAKDAGRNLNTEFYRQADELANALIKYRFYQEEDVKEITFSGWESSEIGRAHV